MVVDSGVSGGSRGSYNFIHVNPNPDDIQGTAAVAVAAVLGGIKIQKPECKELVVEARGLRYLFHGAGSANLGAASLLVNEANVPQSQVACTHS